MCSEPIRIVPHRSTYPCHQWMGTTYSNLHWYQTSTVNHCDHAHMSFLGHHSNLGMFANIGSKQIFLHPRELILNKQLFLPLSSLAPCLSILSVYQVFCSLVSRTVHVSRFTVPCTSVPYVSYGFIADSILPSDGRSGQLCSCNS